MNYTGSDWKELARTLCDEHAQLGASMVSPGTHNPQRDTAVYLEVPLLEVEGKNLSAKEVKAYLWSMRKERQLKRDGFFVWSLYNEEDKKSYVGLGAFTRYSVGERLKGMRELHGQLST